MQSDTELQTVVEGFLDDVVRDYNSHMYEFNKRTDSGITIVDGTASYELNAAFYRESLAYLVDGSSAVGPPMTYLPWAQFQRSYGNTEFVAAGTPQVYSLRNVNNDGLVTLGPTPSSGVADTYTLSVEYYRRIPLLSDDTGGIEAMPEIEAPLIYGAQKRLAIHLYGPGHEDVAGFEALEQKALRELKGADKRHPDVRNRFRLTDHARKRREQGVVYHRIK